uniref:Uncharacterized protein n=1 Tax=Panagrolaimus davidi TaxID=227884 RepID=A0A914QW09_9BILA
MRQEHAIEVQPAENRPETLEGYDEYAEETVNKPLETPVAAIDGETKAEKIPSKNSTRIVPIFIPVTPTPTAPTIPSKTVDENEPISNVEDVMILRTVKPLCSIHEPCD